MALRNIIGPVGFVILVIVLRKTFIITDAIQKMLVMVFLLAFLALITNTFHGTMWETYFIYLPLSVILLLIYSYVVAYCLKKYYGVFDFDLISRYIVYGVCLQCIISVVMYISPDIKDLLLNKITISEYKDSFARVGNQRLIGLGSQYFGLGVVNSFALLFVAERFKDPTNTKARNIRLILIFSFITIVGAMMARTTLVGTAISFVMLGIHFQKYLKKILKYFIYGAIFAAIIIVVLPPNIRNQLSVPFEFAFEMVYSYQDTGEFNTKSSDDLIDQLANSIPKKAGTWFIGDGLWSADDTGAYYGSDVGYYRLLYYFGLFGTLVYIYYQSQAMWQANIRTKRKHQLFFIFAIVIFLILNLKAFVEVIAIFSLFFFAEEPDAITEDTKQSEISLKK
jgi:hypothetical protein